MRMKKKNETEEREKEKKNEILLKTQFTESKYLSGIAIAIKRISQPTIKPIFRLHSAAYRILNGIERIAHSQICTCLQRWPCESKRCFCLLMQMKTTDWVAYLCCCYSQIRNAMQQFKFHMLDGHNTLKILNNKFSSF